MKRLILSVAALCLMLAVGFSPVVLATGELPFQDVPADAWYHSNVVYVYENGLMAGVSSNKFAPKANMSRAMLVTVLHRIAGEPKATTNHPFTDVPSDTWYSNAVAWSYENGIVYGTSETKFSPNMNISREAMVTIFYRYAIHEGMDTSRTANLAGYADYYAISSWAMDAMSWAVGNGIISGVGNRRLAPKATADRAACAAVIQRYVEWTKDPTGTDVPDIPEPTEPRPTEPSTPEPTDPPSGNDGGTPGIGTPETEDHGFCPDCGRRVWTTWYPEGCFSYLDDTMCECGVFVRANECHHH